MEHLSYNYLILLNLLKGGNHLRQIAKDVKLNHMTVKRILDELVNENVLDVKKQGKNLVFTIKNTIEAEATVLMAEIYKFKKLINYHPELKQDIKELRKTKADMILLFGSYAKGLETKNSDIDIYIETTNNNIKKTASGINNKLMIKIGKYDGNNLLIKEIIKNHIIIKGFERFYEKNKFFD